MSRKQYCPPVLGIRASSLLTLLILLALTGLPAHAANFQFSTLIQLGSATAGAGNWELQAGANTGNVNPYFVDGASNAFTIQYTKATNTATLTVGSSSVSFNPTGGAAVAANATWTLPASAFSLTAIGPFAGSISGGTLQGTSITVSNLALSGVTGAINILQPLSQTTLTATRTFFQGTVTAAETGNAVFKGDANGNWKLTGNITLTGFDAPTSTLPNDLTFAFSALASDTTATPEPSTFATLALGFTLVLAGYHRRGRKSTKALQS